MNTKGITPGTFKALPHPYMLGSWTIAGTDEQGRTLHVRDSAGGACHWHKRADAIARAATFNEATKETK